MVVSEATRKGATPSLRAPACVWSGALLMRSGRRPGWRPGPARRLRPHPDATTHLRNHIQPIESSRKPRLGHSSKTSATRDPRRRGRPAAGAAASSATATPHAHASAARPASPPASHPPRGHETSTLVPRPGADPGRSLGATQRTWRHAPAPRRPAAHRPGSGAPARPRSGRRLHGTPRSRGGRAAQQGGAGLAAAMADASGAAARVTPSSVWVFSTLVCVCV